MHKTQDDVSIPLPPQAIVLLEEGFQNQRVFKVNANQVTNRYLKEISEKAKIKKKITFHCARHTFATISLSIGIPLEVVSKLLGHKDLKTTMIYAKILDDLKIKYMEKWDEIQDQLDFFTQGPPYSTLRTPRSFNTIYQLLKF